MYHRIGRRDLLRMGVGAGVTAALLPGCGKSTAPVDATAIIVGSGFGGAVAALRLTQAGVKTIIIERGRRWDIDSPPQQDDPFCTNLQPDSRAFWLRTKTETPVGPSFDIGKYIGVLDHVDGNGMDVYRGAAYGGGSIVYGGIILQPSQSRFELTFPSDVSYAEMAGKYFPRAQQMINASAMPDDVRSASVYTFANTFQAAAAKANLMVVPLPTATDWSLIRQELAGTLFASATHGELIYGNNTGSKVSVDRTYLKLAEMTGRLDVRLQTMVRNVSVESGQRYAVEVDLITETGDVQSSETLTCNYLFLAAGSLGSTEILLRSRASGGLSKLDDQVGQNWSNNGDLMFGLAGYTAPTGSMQGGPPAIGIDDEANSLAPTYAELAQYPLGYETHSTLHLGVAMTKTTGQLVLNSDGQAIAQFPQSGIDEARAAMNQTIMPMISANNLKMDTSISADGFVEGFTYHPLGGASMNAVCDTYGRVKGYKGLYVVDGALMPGASVGMNPALTITAIAERALDEIIAHDLKT